MSRNLISRKALAQLKAMVVGDSFNEAVECPCCGQNVRTYRRPLSVTSARCLKWLVECHDRTGAVWVHFAKTAPRALANCGGEFARLAHWGLIEARPKDGSGKSHGAWRVTDAGRAFAAGVTTIPRYAVVYNNVVQGFDGDRIDISALTGEEIDKKALGPWLKTFRTQRGVGQRQLGRMINVRHSYLYAIENGVAPASRRIREAAFAAISGRKDG